MHKEFLLLNRHFHDLNPLLCGWEKCESKHSFGPSAREYYLIHYVVSGSGVFHTQWGSYPVKAGEIFLIRPGEITTYTADRNTPWYYIWVGFDGELSAKLDDLAIPVFPYQENTFLDLLHCEEKNSMREEFVASKLFELLANIFDDKNMNIKYEKLAYDYIVSNFMRPVHVEEIANHLGINRQYLSRLFKAEYQMTMQEFLVQSRLRYAAILLQRGTAVSQAAYMCGYEDVFNFSKMFKKKFGISPSECMNKKTGGKGKG